MSFDSDKAFVVENGFIVDGNAGFFSGAGTPTDSAPEGSIYLDTTNYKTYRMVSAVWVLDVVTEFSDNQFRIYDNSDITKKAIFNADNITTGTSRTYILPDENGTLATREYVDARRFQTFQFQLLGQYSYSLYLFSGHHRSSADDRESGNSNGYQYQDCSPTACGLNGTITSGSIALKGCAIAGAIPASNVEMLFELWKVGFGNEGTKLGDIIFNIDSTANTVGQYYNSFVATDLSQGEAQSSIDVHSGQLLALKFITQVGDDKIVSFLNATVTLEASGVIG